MTRPAAMHHLRTCKKCGFILVTVNGKDVCPKRDCKKYGKEQ